MEHPPVPIRPAPHGRRGSNTEMAADPGGIDDPSFAGLAHVEGALAMTLLVVIAMGEERAQLQRDRRTADQPVGHHRARDALLHPDPLLDGAAGDRPAEQREHAVQLHALELAIALGKDRSIPVLVGREWLHIAVIRPDPFVEGGHEHHALDRRIQGGDQQAVVATRVDAGHGSRRVATQPVGHQPLALDCRLEMAKGLRVELKRHGVAQAVAIVSRVLMSSGRRSSAERKSPNGTRRVINRSKIRGHFRSACWKCSSPISKYRRLALTDPKVTRLPSTICRLITSAGISILRLPADTPVRHRTPLVPSCAIASKATALLPVPSRMKSICPSSSLMPVTGWSSTL